MIPSRIHMLLLAAALLAGLLGLSRSASAEPRFAVREGLPCSACHVNRTGGGMRTPFGVAWAQSNLPTWRSPGVFDPRLGESVSIGANLRLDERSVLPASTTLESKHYHSTASSSFESTEGNLYVRADATLEEMETLWQEAKHKA